jgi:hypothetical protein
MDEKAHRNPRAAIVRWLRGEIRRYEQHQHLFQHDAARLAQSAHCLRKHYLALRYWRKQPCTS